MDDQLRLLDTVFRTDAFWWLPPLRPQTSRQISPRPAHHPQAPHVSSASLSYLFDDLTLSRAERAAHELASASAPSADTTHETSEVVDAVVDDHEGAHAAWMHALRPELYRLFVERKSFAVFGSGKRPDSSSEHARAEHEALVVCRAGLHALALNPSSHESWWALGNAYEHLLRLVSDAFDASIDQALGLSPAATHVATSALLQLMVQRHSAPSPSSLSSSQSTGATSSSSSSYPQVSKSGCHHLRMGRSASAATAVGASAVVLYGDRMHADQAPALAVWKDLLKPFLNNDDGGSGTRGGNDDAAVLSGSELPQISTSVRAWESGEIDRASILEIQGLAARLGLQQQQQLPASSSTTTAAASNLTVLDISGDAMEECDNFDGFSMIHEATSTAATAAAPAPACTEGLVRPQDALAALFAHAYRALCGRCYAAAAAAYARGARLSWQPPPVMPLLPTPGIWFASATQPSDGAHLESSNTSSSGSSSSGITTITTTDRPFGWLVPSENSKPRLQIQSASQETTTVALSSSPSATTSAAARPWFCPPPDGVGGPQLLHLVRALEALCFHMYGARQALPKPPMPKADARAPAEGGRREWFASHPRFAWPPPPDEAEPAAQSAPSLSSSSSSLATASARPLHTSWLGAVGWPDGGRSVTCSSEGVGAAWTHLRTAKATEMLDLLKVVDAITRPSPGSIAAAAEAAAEAAAAGAGAEVAAPSEILAPLAAMEDATDNAACTSSSSSGSNAAALRSTFQVGEKIEARWLGGDLFYPASVVAVHITSPDDTTELGESMGNQEEQQAGQDPMIPSTEAPASYDLLYDDKEAESGVQLLRMRRPKPRAQCLPLRPWGCALLRAKLQLKLIGKVATSVAAAAIDRTIEQVEKEIEVMDESGALEEATAGEETEASFTKEVLESYQEVLAACAGTLPVTTTATAISSPTSPRARDAATSATAGATEGELQEYAPSSSTQVGLGGLPKESMKIGALSTAGYDALCLLHCARAKVVSRWLRTATPPPVGVLVQLERFAFHRGDKQQVAQSPISSPRDYSSTSSSGEASSSLTTGETSSSSSSSSSTTASAGDGLGNPPPRRLPFSFFEPGSIGQRLEAVLVDCIRALLHVLKALPYHHRAIAGLAHAHAEKRRCQAVCGPRAKLTLQLAPGAHAKAAMPESISMQGGIPSEGPSLESGASGVANLGHKKTALSEAHKLAHTLLHGWGLEVTVESRPPDSSGDSNSDLPILRIKRFHPSFRDSTVAAAPTGAMDTELDNAMGGDQSRHQTGSTSSSSHSNELLSFPSLRLSDALAVCSAAFPDKRAKAAKGRLKLRKPSARPAAASWLQPLMSGANRITTPTTNAAATAAALGAARTSASEEISSSVFGFGLGLGEGRSLLQSSSIPTNPSRSTAGGGTGQESMDGNNDDDAVHSPSAPALKTWLDLCPKPGDELVSIGGVDLTTWFRAYEAYASYARDTDAAVAAANATTASVADTTATTTTVDHMSLAFPVTITKWESGFKFNLDSVMTSPDGTHTGAKVRSFDKVPSEDSMDDIDDFVEGSEACRVQMVRHPALAQGLQVGDVLVAIEEAAATATAPRTSRAADSEASTPAMVNLTIESSSDSQIERTPPPPPHRPLEHLPHQTTIDSLQALPLGLHTLWFWRPPTTAAAGASNTPLTEEPQLPPPLPDPLLLAVDRALLLGVERSSPHRQRCSPFAAPPPPVSTEPKPPPPLPPLLPPSLEPLSQPPPLSQDAGTVAKADDNEEDTDDVRTQRMSLASSIRGNQGNDEDHDRDVDASASFAFSQTKVSGDDNGSSDEGGLSDLDDDNDNDDNEEDTATQATDAAAASNADTESSERKKGRTDAGEQTTTGSVAESRRARLCRKQQSASKKSSSSSSATAKDSNANSSSGGSNSASAAAAAAAAKETEIEMALAPGPGGSADVDLLRRRGNQEAGKWLEKFLAKRLPQVTDAFIYSLSSQTHVYLSNTPLGFYCGLCLLEWELRSFALICVCILISFNMLICAFPLSFLCVCDKVVAIWVPETATSSWEASIVRTRAFDRLRIKYASHFAAVFTQDLAADPPSMLLASAGGQTTSTSSGSGGSNSSNGRNGSSSSSSFSPSSAVVATAHAAWMAKSKDLLERAAGHCLAVKPTRRDRTNQILEADLLNAAASAHLAHAIHALAHRHRAQGSFLGSGKSGGGGGGSGGGGGKGTSSSNSSNSNSGLLSASAVSSLLSLAFDRHLHVTETFLDGAPPETGTESTADTSFSSSASSAPPQQQRKQQQDGRIGLEGRCNALVVAAATLSRAHLAPSSSTSTTKAKTIAAAPLRDLPSPRPAAPIASPTSPRASVAKDASVVGPLDTTATAAAPAPQVSPAKTSASASAVVISGAVVTDSTATPATSTGNAKTAAKSSAKSAATAAASTTASSSSRKARALAKVQACMALHGTPWYAPGALPPPLNPWYAANINKRPRSPLPAEVSSQQLPSAVDPAAKLPVDISIDLSADDPPPAKSPRVNQATTTDTDSNGGAAKRVNEAKSGNAATGTAAPNATVNATVEAAPPVKRRRFTIAEERILASAVATVEATTNISAATSKSSSSSNTATTVELSWESVREACAAFGAEGLADKWSAAELRDRWKKLKVKLAKQEQDAAEQQALQQQEQVKGSSQTGSAPSHEAGASSTSHSATDTKAGFEPPADA